MMQNDRKLDHNVVMQPEQVKYYKQVIKRIITGNMFLSRGKIELPKTKRVRFVSLFSVPSQQKIEKVFSNYQKIAKSNYSLWIRRGTFYLKLDNLVTQYI